ncbi:MAG: DUF1837 domain-containing protein [Algoriphagus sp.]|uniref:HamA C-terminal domain-containing protein n=1 Tax=Algoriphagus sp. TaxID=1872435 RepID=UPI002731D2BC|nr:DUF1837 domain-containing protein [Algoriphagus sp.]MDP2042256.1 DUF1837 domain-containing protein [Algoriphagus sp.]MDP3473251.1 DUF1837 domain-containing protein [Algoriphagus sp.]
MDFKPSISEKFLDLFYKEIECDVPDTNSKLNLHILKIENNQFCYEELIEHLGESMIPFALSRKQIKEFEKDKRWHGLVKEASRKFRDYNVNDGEAGELLLFCFLEAHLKAPKILTKLEIKLSSNDYAKGSDGIHLLELAPKNYQLIFGESKLYQELTTSLTKAFESIHDFKTRKKNNIYDEIGLINSQLCKEAFDEDLYQFLKSVIIPKASDTDPIVKNNAFAIFAGFEIDPTDDEKRLTNDKFLALIKSQIKEDVERKMNHIKKKIEEYELYSYTFYVYVFPFMKLDETRKEIIKKITRTEE